MPYAPQNPFMPNPDGIDDWILPGAPKDPYPDYPDDWIVLPPPAAPNAAAPAPNTPPNVSNPAIANRPVPRPHPLEALWAHIPISAVTWDPPIFPNALGQYPRPAPAPLNVPLLEGLAPSEAGAAEEIGGQLPPKQVTAPRPETSAPASPSPPVSDNLPQAEPTASLTAEGGPSRAEQLRAQRAEQLKVNKAVGTAFENTTETQLKERSIKTGPQITLEMPSGLQNRMDLVTRHPMAGELGCIECKGSATARLSPRQIAGFKELEKNWGNYRR